MQSTKLHNNLVDYHDNPWFESKNFDNNFVRMKISAKEIYMFRQSLTIFLPQKKPSRYLN